jgi:hypothetical protein
MEYKALNLKLAGLWFLRLPGNIFDKDAGKRIGEAS